MKFKCDNCGRSGFRPAFEVRLRKYHFCSKKCYWEFRRNNKDLFASTKGYTYDYSHQKELKKLERKRINSEFKPKSYWY